VDEGESGARMARIPFRWNLWMLAAAGMLLAAAFAALALFDRPLGGILFLAGMSLLLDGMGQFHPLFALLFPLLALTGAITDASRGLPRAAVRWFAGAGALFALGRVLRRRLITPARRNPALESLTAELATLKAQRDRGEITEEEFRAKRDAAVGAFRRVSSNVPPPSAAESP